MWELNVDSMKTIIESHQAYFIIIGVKLDPRPGYRIGQCKLVRALGLPLPYCQFHVCIGGSSRFSASKNRKILPKEYEFYGWPSS